MTVLCVGNLNLDILFQTDRLPREHEKLTCPEAHVGFGGSAGNTAYWLARLGHDVAMAGALGMDPPGEAHLAHLSAAGVDVRGITREKETSGLAVIFAHGRGKRIIRAPGANACGRYLPKLLEGCRLVYLSGINNGLLEAYGRGAAEKGIEVYYSPAGRAVKSLIREADCLILNADELEGMTGLKEPSAGIVALEKRLVVVTLPEGGCLVFSRGESEKIPSSTLEPLDRTGGGDAFSAGFLGGIVEDLSLRECAEQGNRLAAEVITRWGARPEDLDPGGL